MLMSVVDPMVVAVISETCACLMIGVACMFTPSNKTIYLLITKQKKFIGVIVAN